MKCNTHAGIISDFEEVFVSGGLLDLEGKTFEEQALQLNKTEASLEFAQSFQADAAVFLNKVNAARRAQIERGEAVES